MQHLANKGAFNAGGQLAVRKSTGTALAELHIALLVENMLLPKGVHILLAALNILASLQHNGAQSCLSQDQAGKHTRRTKTNHHRAKSGLPPVHRQGVLVFFRRLGLR